MNAQTIYALSTVYGKSGVAVVRVSGDRALDAVRLMTDIKVENIKPRYAYFCRLQSALDGRLLDKCLVLYFRGPNSFNGEDIVEFQIHGSRAVISGVLDSLASIKDFRLAEPGEFSKRAFYHGKMDLTEAEGLADLIDAETTEQQKYAIRQMDGELKELYSGWRNELVKVLAHLEAFIDFPDEDIPSSIMSDMKNTVFKVENSIVEHLKCDNIGERLREGFRVVIVGPPNAGKSSLLNAVAKREAVIVSDIGIMLPMIGASMPIPNTSIPKYCATIIVSLAVSGSSGYPSVTSNMTLLFSCRVESLSSTYHKASVIGVLP